MGRSYPDFLSLKLIFQGFPFFFPNVFHGPTPLCIGIFGSWAQSNRDTLDILITKWNGFSSNHNSVKAQRTAFLLHMNSFLITSDSTDGRNRYKSTCSNTAAKIKLIQREILCCVLWLANIFLILVYNFSIIMKWIHSFVHYSMWMY